MFRNILVPLDGSPFSEQALPRALAIARRSGGALHLVTVAEDNGPEAESPGEKGAARERDGQLQAAEAYLSAVAKRIPKGAEGEGEVEVTTHALPAGGVVSTLLAELTDHPQDLVVMTTHGRGPLERTWIGSVADGLIRQAPCPVLLLHPDQEGKEGGGTEPREQADAEAGEEGAPFPVAEPFRHLVAPLDRSPLGAAALDLAAGMAELDGAQLTLLHVVPTPPGGAFPYLIGNWREERATPELAKGAEEDLARAAETVAGRGVTATTEIRTLEPPVKGILKTIEDRGADLLVMSTRGRGGVERLMLGSVADKVVRSSPVPVLVFRPVGEG